MRPRSGTRLRSDSSFLLRAEQERVVRLAAVVYLDFELRVLLADERDQVVQPFRALR